MTTSSSPSMSLKRPSRFWRTLRFLAVGGICLWGIVAAYGAATDYIRQRTAPQWRQAEVVRGRLTTVVNASGTVNPVRTISVGSFVSGPIETAEPLADYNQEVRKDDILCKIDPRTYQANLERDEATVLSRKADLERAEALLDQAQRDLERSTNLSNQGKSFLSASEMDKVVFAVKTQKAQVDIARASLQVAESQMRFSQLQLTYCEIRAPEDGMIINRKISPGQTIAAQFQTPELFIIAPAMRARMDVEARVDEADIGLVLAAQEQRLPVTFTVEAYPDEVFEGRVEQVRMNSTVTQNVVTYPVIVAAENPQLKLRPGMTASVSFQVDERADVIKIPNSALRFYPDVNYVRPQDKGLLEGEGSPTQAAADDVKVSSRAMSVQELAEIRRRRNRRHVWVADGALLRAVAVETGLSDSQFTEMVAGELAVGDTLVTGMTIPSLMGTP